MVNPCGVLGGTARVRITEPFPWATLIWTAVGLLALTTVGWLGWRWRRRRTPEERSLLVVRVSERLRNLVGADVAGRADRAGGAGGGDQPVEVKQLDGDDGKEAKDDRE